MVLVQKLPFFQLFFLGNIGQENLFYDIVVRKKALSHGFGPKMALFPTVFFLGNRGQENVFYDILHRKHALVAYKNKKFKKSNN